QMRGTSIPRAFGRIDGRTAAIPGTCDRSESVLIAPSFGLTRPYSVADATHPAGHTALQYDGSVSHADKHGCRTSSRSQRRPLTIEQDTRGESGSATLGGGPGRRNPAGPRRGSARQRIGQPAFDGRTTVRLGNAAAGHAWPEPRGGARFAKPRDRGGGRDRVAGAVSRLGAIANRAAGAARYLSEADWRGPVVAGRRTGFQRPWPRAKSQTDHQQRRIL